MIEDIKKKWEISQGIAILEINESITEKTREKLLLEGVQVAPKKVAFLFEKDSENKEEIVIGIGESSLGIRVVKGIGTDRPFYAHLTSICGKRKEPPT
jgi:hypothetical protein